MRILLTVHQFLPDYSSGTEILTYSTAKELRNMGHDVLVFTAFPARVELSDDARVDEYEYEGLEVVRIHHNPGPMGKQTNAVEAEYNNQFVGRYFVKLIDRFQPDIVHFFHLARLSASLVDVCQDKGIPMILTATDFWFVCPTCQLRLLDNSLCSGPEWLSLNCLRHLVEVTQPDDVASQVRALSRPALALMIARCRLGLLRKRWYAPLVKALANRPQFLRTRLNMINRILTPTRIMATILVKNGLNPDRIIYCPYGIDIPAYSAASKCGSTRRSAHELRVGFIGTLYEHKGTHILVEAVRRLASAPIRLKIYGQLEEFPNYVAKLRDEASNDSRIEFLGTFPNSEIGRIFAELDVLVVPSLWYENSPLVVFSAQASKCPVIAADVGGLSEVVSHEDNGLLFPKGDAGALAKVLERLLSEPTLLTRLCERARPPKSSKKYAADLYSVYNEFQPLGQARAQPGKAQA